MGVLDEIIASQKKFLGDSVSYDAQYPDYVQEVRMNLVEEMGEAAFHQYGLGSGSELDPKDGKPAKMASVRSSSAMTFNLLGNEPVQILGDSVIPDGLYDVAYEKQLWTLGYKGQPANLDACLKGVDNETAVFCEMKMTEPLSTTNFEVRDKYDDRENWFYDGAYEVFHPILEDLRAHRDAFKRYDAAQMFKHTLGIYNNMTTEAPARYGAPVTNEGLVGACKKALLVNVVYEVEEGHFEDLRTQHSYERIAREEREGFETFWGIMMNEKYGLRELFQDKCGIDFDITFRSAGDFAAIQGKAGVGSRLERYWKLL